MNTRNTLRAVRIDTHRVTPITFEPAASRCSGACEGEACNCLRPKHLEPAEACTDLVEPPSFMQPEARRLWRWYAVVLLVVALSSFSAAMGWLR